MTKILIVFLFICNSLYSQTQNVNIVGRVQMVLPTAVAIDGFGGQLGLRFRSEYSKHKYFGFEAAFDNRRYSEMATISTKISIQSKNLQLGFPFSFGDVIEFTVMPCISIHLATKVTAEQGNTKIQIPDNIVKSSAVSAHDKSLLIEIAKKTSERIAFTCSAQYIFSANSKSIIQVGLSYKL